VSESETQRGRVLVVEDDPKVRFTLTMLLDEDFETDGVESGTHALEQLKSREFDVVLSDYQMPGLDGVTLLRRVHELDPNVMGILVTGHGEAPNVRSAEENGMVVRVIAKPYDPARLLKLVGNTVRLARVQRALQRGPAGRRPR
jgi:two-component system C4-dicarboxylate transport response regulator DctD